MKSSIFDAYDLPAEIQEILSRNSNSQTASGIKLIKQLQELYSESETIHAALNRKAYSENYDASFKTLLELKLKEVRRKFHAKLAEFEALPK